MNPPFTKEAFLQVFETYNLSVYPAQIVLYALALISLYFLVRRRTYSNAVIYGVLVILWGWSGIFYHWAFFTDINPAAYVFGGLFVLEGFFLLIAGTNKKLVFGFRKDARALTGWFFMIYALLIYPVLGYLAGHPYPAQPTFGLPCPLVIFTFGMLMQTTRRINWHLWIIPVIWALIGSTAVFAFGILEDAMLLIAGLVFLVFRRINPV